MTTMNSKPESSEAAVPPYSIFGPFMKRYIVFTASGATLFSSLSAQIYFPALNTLADEMGVSSSLINLTVTSYMIFQGISPMFLGSFADQAGRRPTYIICFTIYVAANIGLAVQSSYTSLIILRCLQSAGISSTLALAAASVADIATKEERGLWMGITMSGTFVGQAFGPVIGGLLAQYLGWRSIFWFLTIASGVFFLPLLFFMPETARQVVGNGSTPAQKWNRPFVQYFQCSKQAKEHDSSDSDDDPDRPSSSESDLKPKRKFAFPNPIQPLVLVFHRSSLIVLLVTGIIMAGNMTVLSSITSIYSDVYGLDVLEIGLCYITMGVGSVVASIASGRLMDKYYRHLASKKNPEAGDEPVRPEKARTMILIPLVCLGAMTVLAFGWVLKYSVHLAVPEVLLFFCGLGLTGGFICASTLLVDLHQNRPAAATASNNLVRSLCSAGASAAIDPMLKALGYGWCFTVVMFVLLAALPFLVILSRFGRRPAQKTEA